MLATGAAAAVGLVAVASIPAAASEEMKQNPGATK
jgi:hypothetical protein